VRDLLFARKLGKKQIPRPVKNQTGFDIFSSFSAACYGHDRKLVPCLGLEVNTGLLQEPERVDPFG
jgi:hypothetical protein